MRWKPAEKVLYSRALKRIVGVYTLVILADGVERLHENTVDQGSRG
jgi:hypothetical protein